MSSKIKKKLMRKKFENLKKNDDIVRTKDKKPKKKKTVLPKISIKNAKHNGRSIHATYVDNSFNDMILYGYIYFIIFIIFFCC